jgi:hypothetical protein
MEVVMQSATITMIPGPAMTKYGLNPLRICFYL